MVQRPESLKVGAKTYRFLWDQENWDEGEYGRTNHVKLTISINTMDPAEEQQQDTVLHEVLHCIFAQIGNPANYTQITEAEEHWVTTMTPWLHGIMKDNPVVFDFILGADD